MIELQDIKKSFGDKEILKGVSTTMEPGKVNLIIGSSGSGKTVMMKCIVGLMKVDSGTVLYDKQDFTAMDDKEKKGIRQEIGMLFQGSALFDSMTVEQNVMFPLEMFGTGSLRDKKKARGRMPGKGATERRRQKVPRRNQRRHEKKSGHRPCHCAQPKVSFL